VGVDERALTLDLASERTCSHAPQRGVELPGRCRDEEQARVREFHERRLERIEQGRLALGLGPAPDLIPDHQRVCAAVCTPAIGGDHAQQAARCPDLIVAQHEALEAAGVGSEDAVEDACLLPARRGKRDGRLLDREQVVQADQGRAR
jgi:hypothetical protein